MRTPVLAALVAALFVQPAAADDVAKKTKQVDYVTYKLDGVT